MIRKVLPGPAQSEEIAQELMLDVWRIPQRSDPSEGNATIWTLTMAHRRAADGVCATQASRDRIERMATGEGGRDVDEEVHRRFESQQVQQALNGLSDLQWQAIELAYYGGYSYLEAAQELGAPLGTVEARLRDGLIRLRATMAVAS